MVDVVHLTEDFSRARMRENAEMGDVGRSCKYSCLCVAFLTIDGTTLI